MSKAPSTAFLKVLRATISGRPIVCATCRRQRQRVFQRSARSLTTETSSNGTSNVPIRKQLKDAAKAKKAAAASPLTLSSDIDSALLGQYELTVGIEIHAELSTSTKLFSPAATSLTATPNTHVSPFDAALPGAQPQLQKAVLLPAIRAALALGCQIQSKSGWDRKHYFWWDQPNGYQITQYYHPFAVDGSLTLTPGDYHSLQEPITVGIKQVQMEQDTAKTVLQPPSTHLLDLNRVSHPLIEIISLPHIHTPSAAAAFVKKVQSILKAVGACETGMEMGGLRCDVNVSVMPRASEVKGGEGHSYAGVTGLGQRTEIKNLSSIAAVAAAVTAERNRQILLSSSGGTVEGETRGWTLGATSTHRLRGKEGEVDYRYMPDPDLAPLLIGRDLVDHLRDTLPELPSDTVTRLVQDYGVTEKDALTLAELEDGERLDFYFCVLVELQSSLGERVDNQKKSGKTVANWVLHELGALLTAHEKPFAPEDVPADWLARLLALLLNEQITLPTAKNLLSLGVEEGVTEFQDLDAYIDEHALRLQALPDSAYEELAKQLMAGNTSIAAQATKEAVALEMAEKVEKEKETQSDIGKPQHKQKKGKVMWFVGQMVRRGEAGRVQPERAEKVVRSVLLERAASSDV